MCEAYEPPPTLVEVSERTEAIVLCCGQVTMIRPPNSVRRLPLPPNVTQMTEAHEPALAVVKAFTEQLSDLTLESWLAIGRAVMAARSATRYVSAWSSVEQAIAKHGLALAAWHVRDDIETIAYLACHSGAPMARLNRPVFAAAHGAAEDAALALLVHTAIEPAALELMCAPFATQVPRERFAAPNLLRAIRPRDLAREY